MRHSASMSYTKRCDAMLYPHSVSAYINGFVQDCGISVANAKEKPLSCTNTLIYVPYAMLDRIQHSRLIDINCSPAKWRQTPAVSTIRYYSELGVA